MSYKPTDSIPHHEVPRDVIKEAGMLISDYVIGFVKLRKQKASEEGNLGGTGTLVQINGAFGILTAHHVLEPLKDDPEIGLVVTARSEPTPHRVTLRKETVQPFLIAKGPHCDGPDLGFLILSPVDSKSLLAKKSFFNLLAHHEAALDHPPALNEGIWLLCGFADDLTSEYGPHRGQGCSVLFTSSGMTGRDAG